MVCPFCRIAREKERIIRAKRTVFVVLSDPRLMPGHTLVIPKRHVEKISELTNEERKEIFDILVEVEEKILATVASGCDIRQNYRPFMAQDKIKIDHLHFHLQPRELKDELYRVSQKFERRLFKKLPESERKRFTTLLRRKLKSRQERGTLRGSGDNR